MSRVRNRAREPVPPRKPNELLLKLASEWDERINIISPDNQDTFITL